MRKCPWILGFFLGSGTDIPGRPLRPPFPAEVNESYIKPVTAAAGKMSWALLMNPEGLDADLFITHAWQAGTGTKNGEGGIEGGAVVS